MKRSGARFQTAKKARNEFPGGGVGSGGALAALPALLPLLAVFFLFLLPALASLSAGFRTAPGAGLPHAGLPHAALPRSALSVTLFTLKQALLSTLLALLLGLPGAWFGVKRRFLRALTGIPFAMPPVLVVLAFVLFFGRSGWLNRFFMTVTGAETGPLNILYRPAAVILAHGFYNFPIVVRLAGDGIAAARKSWAQAAESLGASPFRAALTVVLPIAAPSLLTSSLLVFLYCFTSFAIVLALGGGPAVTTVAVEIYRHARISMDFRTAGMLAVTETLFSLAVFFLYILADRAFHRERETGRAAAGEERPGRETAGSGAARAGYAALLFLLVLLPLLAIPVQSFLVRSGWRGAPALSLKNWTASALRVFPALGRSLFLAALSASFAALLALLAAAGAHFAGEKSLFGRALRLSAALPLVSSGVTLGLGYYLLYGRGAVPSGIVAVGLLAAFHAVIALPFAFNAVYQGYRDVPAGIARAAATLGAAPFARLATVEIPLAAARFRTAWAFAAAISLGELNGVLLIGPDGFETLPVLVYRAAGAYRYGEACAAGTMLIASCAAAFLLSEKKKEGRFVP